MSDIKYRPFVSMHPVPITYWHDAKHFPYDIPAARGTIGFSYYGSNWLTNALPIPTTSCCGSMEVWSTTTGKGLEELACLFSATNAGIFLVHATDDSPDLRNKIYSWENSIAMFNTRIKDTGVLHYMHLDEPHLHLLVLEIKDKAAYMKSIGDCYYGKLSSLNGW